MSNLVAWYDKLHFFPVQSYLQKNFQCNVTPGHFLPDPSLSSQTKIQKFDGIRTTLILTVEEKYGTPVLVPDIREILFDWDVVHPRLELRVKELQPFIPHVKHQGTAEEEMFEAEAGCHTSKVE